jgi:uncharacterized membrane protein
MAASDPSAHPPPLHRRHALLRQVWARPRLLICIGIGLAAGLVFPADWRVVTRLLLGWNVAIWLYLVLVGLMLAKSTPETIRRRAQSQDEGRIVVLILTCFAAVASIGAIVAQLAATKDMIGLMKALHISLAASTILTAFAFIHISFALHYAHEFVLERRSTRNAPNPEGGGLIFPGTDVPDYFDFLYFSFVIGVAAQTADVAICSKRMRRVALLHCVLAFFFNTTVLALTINIAAGLI